MDAGHGRGQKVRKDDGQGAVQGIEIKGIAMSNLDGWKFRNVIYTIFEFLYQFLQTLASV